MLPRVKTTPADVMLLQRRAPIIILCAVVVGLAGSCLAVGASKIDGEAPCESVLFCHGTVIHEMQLSALFKDSKEYVDRPLLVDPREILNALKTSTGKVPRSRLQEILDTNFSKVGDDLEAWVPGDWREAEGDSLITRITDRTLREWADSLHLLWKDLGRKTAQSVKEFPDRHSLIHLPYPFIVHANGENSRTREQRYWESYWTIHGLLISEMYSTAKGMILNFAHLIDRFGYVPVANRVYYQQRPQPPLLAAMVHLYWHHVKSDADDLIKTVLPAIVKEYSFWMTSRSVDVTVAGKKVTLNRYKSTVTKPRPESYREDLDSAKTLRVLSKDRASRIPAEEKFFGSISAASESGWEFSTRWLSPTRALADISTEDIVPVDLNAFLCLTEKHLSFFYKLTGDDKRSQEFNAKATVRGNAIRDVFWNDGLNMWRDYDLRDNRQREDFYMSSLTPLFAMCSPDNMDVMSVDFQRRIMNSNDVQKLLKYPGGMPASFVEALNVCHGCQWDFPNFWPPLSLYLIEPLSRVEEMYAVARNISQKVINALYTDGGVMFEKYNVLKPGMYGRGGEYHVMQGYAPTNGAVLRILEIFPTLKAPQNNEVVDEGEQNDHHHVGPSPSSRNDIPRDPGHMAFKSGPPVQSALVVPSPTAEERYAPLVHVPRPTDDDKSWPATNVPFIPDSEPPMISVQPVVRIRMDQTTTVASPAYRPVQQLPNVRPSKAARDSGGDGSRNCQSSISSSVSLLLIWVIAMFFC